MTAIQFGELRQGWLAHGAAKPKGAVALELSLRDEPGRLRKPPPAVLYRVAKSGLRRRWPIRHSTVPLLPVCWYRAALSDRTEATTPLPWPPIAFEAGPVHSPDSPPNLRPPILAASARRPRAAP